MNLQDISDIYEKNLIEFFHNEKVIECIYTEQYGEENYKKNKKLYHSTYNEILNNTMFIPYVTLDHLREYINSERIRYGQKYVEKNLKNETQLLKRLTFEEKKIIKNYTITLIENLNKILPQANKIDLQSILHKNSFSSIYESIYLVNDALNNSKKSPLFKLRYPKIKKCIAKYEKDVKEKILIETSSYFKHRAEAPNDKYYSSILSGMLEDGQFVSQYIGKDSTKNYRYIYLPILQYQTKEEYLKIAIHEVMHISKEKISKNKYRSGLFERDISANKSGILTVSDNLLSNFIQNLRWHSLTKDIDLPKENKIYHLYKGHSTTEEVMHHWQVRNVVKKMLENHLIDLLKMPYKNESFCKRHVTYEFPDETTKQFMNIFGNYIQKINTGELSIKKFKAIVGNSNYELLCNLYESWTTQIPKTITGASSLCSTVDNNILFNKYQQSFSQIGNSLILQMENNSSKSKKDTILKKTADILSMDICEIGDILKTKLEKHKYQPSSLSRSSQSCNTGNISNRPSIKSKKDSPTLAVSDSTDERY